jgi:hypothetical protein
VGKSSGLGDFLWLGGVDLSSDTQSGKVSGSVALLDFTGINNLAFVRQGGQRQAALTWTSYFDGTVAHPLLSALPTTDVLGTYVTNLGSASSAIGNPAFCMQGLQLNYDPTRSTASALTFAVTADSDNYGGEWGLLLTPGIRTDTGATNGTDFDAAGGFTTPSVPATTVAVQNTSPLPYSVVVSGGTVTLVTVNGTTVGSGDGTYAVPAGASIALTYSAAPTWTWTVAPPSYGAQAYLQVFAFTGTDATVAVQGSPDNSTWTTISGLTFAQTTSGPGTQRVASSTSTAIPRYLRAITTTSGGFSSLEFAVVLVRNPLANQAF